MAFFGKTNIFVTHLWSSKEEKIVKKQCPYGDSDQVHKQVYINLLKKLRVTLT